MMQLLSIHSTPIQYQMHIEAARLEASASNNSQPTAQVTTQTAQLELHNTNTQIQENTYGTRKSLGLLNATDFARSAAQKGEQHITEVTQDSVTTEKQLSHIEKNVTIGDIIKQKALEQPQYKTVFLPNGGTQISWEQGQASADYKPASTTYDWNIQTPSFNFIPGSFSLQVTQMPSVDIKYLGGFNYVPPSANPDYVPPAGTK